MRSHKKKAGLQRKMGPNKSSMKFRSIFLWRSRKKKIEVFVMIPKFAEKLEFYCVKRSPEKSTSEMLFLFGRKKKGECDHISTDLPSERERHSLARAVWHHQKSHHLFHSIFVIKTRSPCSPSWGIEFKSSNKQSSYESSWDFEWSWVEIKKKFDLFLVIFSWDWTHGR